MESYINLTLLFLIIELENLSKILPPRWPYT